MTTSSSLLVTLAASALTIAKVSAAQQFDVSANLHELLDRADIAPRYVTPVNRSAA